MDTRSSDQPSENGNAGAHGNCEHCGVALPAPTRKQAIVRRFCHGRCRAMWHLLQRRQAIARIHGLLDAAKAEIEKLAGGAR